MSASWRAVNAMGLIALCVQVGLAALQATMDNEVAERVGPKGKQGKTDRRIAH